MGNGDHVEVMMAFHLDAAGLKSGNPVVPVLIELLRDPWLGTFAPLWSPRKPSPVTRRVSVTQYPPSPPLGPAYPSLLILGARAEGDTTATALEQALRARLQVLRHDGPPEEALDAARKRAKRVLAERLADVRQRSAMVARCYATTGGTQALETLYQGIGAITADRVREAASRLFLPDNTTVGVMTTEPREGATMPDPPMPPEADKSAPHGQVDVSGTQQGEEVP